MTTQKPSRKIYGRHINSAGSITSSVGVFGSVSACNAAGYARASSRDPVVREALRDWRENNPTITPICIDWPSLGDCDPCDL